MGEQKSDIVQDVSGNKYFNSLPTYKWFVQIAQQQVSTDNE